MDVEEGINLMKSSGGLSRFFCRKPSQLYMTCRNGHAAILLPAFQKDASSSLAILFLSIALPNSSTSTFAVDYDELHEVGSPLQQSA